MSRKQLLSRVGDQLHVIGHERELAANTLLQWIVARLKYDQSIRISGIGVFQLKKEPLPREERKTFVDDGPKNKRTLVYAPVQDEMSKSVNSAFVSFDIDELNINSSDYLEKVFSLNVDKPLIPVQDRSSSGFASKVLRDNHEETLEEKIERMVTEGEILTDYNIFESYLLSEDTDKSTNEIEEDDIVKEELLKSIRGNMEEETPGPQGTVESEAEEYYSIPGFIPGFPDGKNDNEKQKPEQVMLTPEDFDDPREREEERSGEEITDDFSEKKKDKTDTREQEIVVKGIEPVSKEEKFLEELEKTIIFEEDDHDKVESKNEDLFARLENYLNDDGTDGRETESGLDVEAENKAENKEESEGGMNSTKEMINKIRDANETHRNKSFFAKRGFILTAAIIAVAAVLIFVFLSGDEDSSSANESITETQTDPDQTVFVSQTEDSVSAINNVQEDSVERTGLYRDIPNDAQIAKQIYFDGSQYTVQVSSWKNSTIAEKEVEKLRSKDFDAFIFKIYLESKQSTWHRVRVGYFHSLEEAEDFIIKNKF